MWRERLLTALMVPVLVLPLLVIAAGGDLDILWHEATVLVSQPIVVTVYAQIVSPTVVMGPSPTVVMSPTIPSIPSGTVMMSPSPGGTNGPGGGAGPGSREAPLLSRWGYISASVLLALIGSWFLAGRVDRARRRP